MRIRILSDNRVFEGTATEIVERMRRADHRIYESLNSYIQSCFDRLSALYGEAPEAGYDDQANLCDRFIQFLIDKGHAKLEKGGVSELFKDAA